ncbi:MAG: MltA domain-containing protein [Alphaproteobacteria bacterium]|nr:MltA domain-containing protein [Alphaproteobacteria bacterium SS10]
MKHLFFALALAALAACATADTEDADTPDEVVLSPASWSDLPGWRRDQIADIRPALNRSCDRIGRLSATRNIGPDGIGGTAGDWQVICDQLQNTPDQNLRPVIEQILQPYRVTGTVSGETGLFTGYFEPSLNGSLTQTGPYQTPIHGRPDDLVMVQLGGFRDDLRGRRIAGRVQDGRLTPFEDRAEIVDGALPSDTPVLAWAADPIDVFFLEIQGSGRVNLPDGDQLRIGYAGQNGHPYVPIGRTLIDEGELTRENVSLQSIREWLADNPAEAQRVMNTNPSYVFFREIEGDGPIGAEGVALTPGRSLAVDRSIMPLGVPMFLDADDPLDPTQRFQRLMMAQDTGGAIRGAVRGDVFWGDGAEAELRAGKMRSSGRYWLLLPRSLGGQQLAVAQEAQ